MKLTWNGLRVKKQENSITLAMSALIGSIIAGVTSAAAATANTASQVKTNKQNQENLEKAWERDDAGLQRAREDAQKAGFSPLAALSSNLTNTSPAMMQAPQFDSSGLVDSIQSGAQSYAQLKQQQPLIDEQVKAAKIENDFNKTNNFTRKLQNVANLAKSMRELDQLDLSNYEKASILVANGIPSSTVEKLIPHTNSKGDIPENQGSKYLNLLQQAQTSLANQQSTTQTNQRALLDAQTALNGIQKTIYENENNYNWNQKISVYVPVITSEGNSVKIDWTYSDSIPRKQAFDLIKNAIDTLAIKKAGQDVNSDSFNKIFKALDAIIPF